MVPLTTWTLWPSLSQALQKSVKYLSWPMLLTSRNRFSKSCAEPSRSTNEVVDLVVGTSKCPSNGCFGGPSLVRDIEYLSTG